MYISFYSIFDNELHLSKQRIANRKLMFTTKQALRDMINCFDLRTSLVKKI